MLEAARKKIIPLKGLGFQQLRRRFRVRQAGEITALDVDGPVLRVVQAATRGADTIITRVAAAPLELAADADRSDPAVLAKAIRAALDSLHLRVGLAVMGVPRAQVVLRTLSLPVIANFRELASIVHFQVSKDLPFRKEHAVIDFRVRRQPLAPALVKVEDASVTEQPEPAPVAQK